MKKQNTSNGVFMPDDLKKEIDVLMHPEKDTTAPRISIIFAFEEEGGHEDTIQKINQIKSYTTFTRHSKIFYKIDFAVEEAKCIHEVYQLIDGLPHKEIIINGFKLPYSGSLWLPLLWFYL